MKKSDIQSDSDELEQSEESEESEKILLPETVNSEQKEGDFFDKTTSFKELGVCDEMLEVCEKLGYKHPTKIQK